MSRGGTRPGAGAPPGNLNAFKHGRTSPRLRQLASALAAIPEVQRLLLPFQRREHLKVRRARAIARHLLQRLLPNLPPYPDPQINQTLLKLRDRCSNTGASKSRQKQTPSKDNNQTPIQHPLHHQRTGVPSFAPFGMGLAGGNKKVL